MKTTRINPHRERRSAINFTIGLLIAAIILLACSCRTPKYGCPSMAELKSHKWDHKYGWIKCSETKRVFVLDKKNGKTICSYVDSQNNNK